jgi:hypothetical protein
MFLEQLTYMIVGGKIETKIILQLHNNLNFYAYQIIKIFIIFKRVLCLTAIKSLMSFTINKNDFVIKNLTKNIKFQLKSKEIINQIYLGYVKQIFL